MPDSHVAPGASFTLASALSATHRSVAHVPPAAMSAPPVEPGKALSYEVYAPGDVIRRQAARGSIAPQKPSLALRVCLVLLGVCIVFGTAAAVILVTTDDAKTKAPSVHLPEGFPPAPLPSSSADLALSPPAAPEIPADPPPEPPTDLPLPPPRPRAVGLPKPVAAGRPASVPTSPANQHAPPPNPYGSPAK